MFNLEDIIKKAKGLGASDVHISPFSPVRYRIDGDLKCIDEQSLDSEICSEMVSKLLGDKYSSVEHKGEIDIAKTFCDDIRCRINIFHQRLGLSIAIRILSENIPKLTDLGLPPAVYSFPEMNKGLVLVTGETGSGKSTTLASVLNTINQNYYYHIITLEDPIEYIYKSEKSLVSQREVFKDTDSYSEGLRAILREDPNVILVGEMRDFETIEIALTAAETGHLVFATVHTKSAAESIDRIVGVFPEIRQKQIRIQLSTTLNAVLSQQLIKRKMGGRVVASELMIVNSAIRNLIREGKTPQIDNALSTSANIGSITMDNSLLNLYKQGVISAEVLKNAARDSEYIKRFI